ncbi:hypothetical protein [Clostridium estertheticum]|uniref:hypothetical protein n=1 Tax=Clostridium estertheticum TaxID=238834 RepID=UPI001C7D52B7|nr:hypothetical protein [Clostridium estertheticum]MBX4267524.1 hypothetical protein [Clostridium estertheticum]WLC91331.1 hypothetical protein KTC95_24245 [Clostridium estertheticum]
MKFKKLSSVLLSVGIACSMLSIGSVPAFAYSSAVSARIPGLDSSHSVESNIWMANINQFSTQSFQVSAYYHGANPGNASWIKTAWNVSATGAGVSIGGVSGSTGGNSFSGSWTNTNAYTSSWSGTYKISGIAVTGNGSNTASVLVSGSTASASASVFRIY